MRRYLPNLLAVLLLAAVVSALVVVVPDVVDCSSAAQARRPIRRPSPYWRAERTLVDALHRLGRANELLRAERRASRGLRRALVRQPSSLEALRLASVVYGVPFDLLYRRASCESTGEQPTNPPSERTLEAHAKNPKSTASGLLQFLTSTWATTPFAGFDIFSAYPSAMAGAWMEVHGRGGEWICQ